MNRIALARQRPMLIHRPLLPSFHQCNELRSSCFERLTSACEKLEAAIRLIGPLRPSSFERAVAFHLVDNPLVVADLCAATRSDLTAHWIGRPRPISSLCENSRFDLAFEAGRIQRTARPGPSWLIAVAQAATGRSDISFRRIEARTAPDVRNCSVVYPPAIHALPRTHAICETLATLPGSHCIASVIWCMTAFLNSHPLPDGNGRVARLLFALGMHRAGLVSGPWLATGPLVYMSNGAFEIALRRAEIQGRWQPIVDVMTAYTEFLVRIFSQPDGARSLRCS